MVFSVGREEIYFFSLGRIFWIGKGDLNKHYDANKDPIQSFLFCIKAPFLSFLFVESGNTFS